MKNLFITFSLLIFIFSCSPTSNPETEAKEKFHKEVMAIHDKVMPKMDDIYNLKKQAKERLASEKDLKKQLKLKHLIKTLDAANELMMQWMRKFEAPDSKTQHQDAMKYYESQKEKISEVKEKMEGIIKKGTKMVK